MTESEDFWQQAYEQAKADMPEHIVITGDVAMVLWMLLAEGQEPCVRDAGPTPFAGRTTRRD